MRQLITSKSHIKHASPRKLHLAWSESASGWRYA